MGEFSNKYLVKKPKTAGEKKKSMQDEVLQSLRQRTKERVAAIHDTESRMPKAQRDAVNAFEKRIQGLKTERMAIIDQDGRILNQSNSGTSQRTRISYQRGTTYPNAIITHNHPTGVMGDNLAGRVNNTLSNTDMNSAILINAKGIRVRIQGGYKYSVERKGDSWGVSSDTFKRELYNLARKNINETYSKIRPMIERKLRNSKSISEYNDIVATYNARMNVAGQHQAMKELAKKYGFIYTRGKA